MHSQCPNLLLSSSSSRTDKDFSCSSLPRFPLHRVPFLAKNSWSSLGYSLSSGKTHQGWDPSWGWRWWRGTRDAPSSQGGSWAGSEGTSLSCVIGMSPRPRHPRGEASISCGSPFVLMYRKAFVCSRYWFLLFFNILNSKLCLDLDSRCLKAESLVVFVCCDKIRPHTALGLSRFSEASCTDIL